MAGEENLILTSLNISPQERIPRLLLDWGLSDYHSQAKPLKTGAAVFSYLYTLVQPFRRSQYLTRPSQDPSCIPTLASLALIGCKKMRPPKLLKGFREYASLPLPSTAQREGS